MRLQIVSDLHLEFGPLDLSVEDTDVLIAAGDIGVGLDGFEWLESIPRPVVYVAGNHEYWGCELLQLNGALTNKSLNSNVRFLENRTTVIGDVRFIGCTLWTNYRGRDEQIMDEMSERMNDFRYIRVGRRLAQPLDFARQHEESRRWLINELALPFAGKTVVVTHHAPMATSWYSQDDDDTTRFAYCNDLTSILSEHDIALWVHGHIHRTNDYVAEGVRVVCNPRGYCDYSEVEEFEPVKIINV